MTSPERQEITNAPFGLYVHIPFCSKICHYCDFAKTANYSPEHVLAYLRACTTQLLAWKETLSPEKKFTSVFFGGGTPGVLSHEYEALMAVIRDMLTADAEVSLESNPGNATERNISTWKSLGFNRLSIGVQSFDDAGLKALTRDHTSAEAKEALELAAKHMKKSNGDLIYGWPGQTDKSWEKDIELMSATGVNHLSLYALTFEGNTPFARAERRGRMRAASGDDLAMRYEVACDLLGKNSYAHEEISNWARPGGECQHNWLYWRGHHFVGIGAGAHGFVDDGTPIGLRYSYPGDLRQFLKVTTSEPLVPSAKPLSTPSPSQSRNSPRSTILSSGGMLDDERDLAAWLYEYVGCALRSREGVDISLLEDRGFQFVPNQKIERALHEGLLFRTENRLLATEAEWFRETAWSYEICESSFYQVNH
jgi:oxygen-independent coproporphyrinogen III oxidase